jgi:hypothetical protein
MSLPSEWCAVSASRHSATIHASFDECCNLLTFSCFIWQVAPVENAALLFLIGNPTGAPV